MSIKLYPFETHHRGGFNGGEILENKPIQLSEDKSKLQPYSNIFYWAHAWSDKGSTIGEHPHKAFEILSFVLKGEIEHYDSKNKSWNPLKTGDVQIIRAGSGISHSEKLGAGAEMFQIWFDPDIRKTIDVQASYDDYSSDSFPVFKTKGYTTKYYAGKDAQLKMTTPNVSIYEMLFEPGLHFIKTQNEFIYSIYVIDGDVKIHGISANKNDFFVAKNEVTLEFELVKSGKLFFIQSPIEVPYETYIQRYM